VVPTPPYTACLNDAQSNLVVVAERPSAGRRVAKLTRISLRLGAVRH
jgi:hypothetical protein